MSLQYKFFIIRAQNPDATEAEFNRFLRTVRVLSIDRKFVEKGENSFWALAVAYLKDSKTSTGSDASIPGRSRKIDYRELLSPEDFTLFAKLRDWRKAVGEKEAVPLYTIFTNEQLARIAQQKIKTLEELSALSGIGNARMKKYGGDVLAVIQTKVGQREKETE
jgi:superfamily II DNA helicase RecQ